MSSIFLSTINCPACGEVSPFERYDIINVSETPQFRESLLDWDLFKFTCNHCDYQVIIDYPTLYVDEENKAIIQYLPSSQDTLNQVERTGFIPPVQDTSEYKYRVVTNLEDFVENVQIFSEGMDDKAIEYMKYLKSPKEEDDLQFSYERIVFTKVGPTAYQFLFTNQKDVVASLNFSIDLYQEALDEVANADEGELFINEYWAEKFARCGLHSF